MMLVGAATWGHSHFDGTERVLPRLPQIRHSAYPRVAVSGPFSLRAHEAHYGKIKHTLYQCFLTDPSVLVGKV